MEICSDYIDRETFERLRRWSIENLYSWSYRPHYNGSYEWFTDWSDLDTRKQCDVIEFLNSLKINHFIYHKQEWIDERVWSYY